MVMVANIRHVVVKVIDSCGNKVLQAHWLDDKSWSGWRPGRALGPAIFSQLD